MSRMFDPASVDRIRTHSSRTWVAAGLRLLVTGGLVGIIFAEPTRAADDKPAPAPPGVIIEPPRPRQNDADAPSTRERQEKQGPGCPANDRKLELIV